MYIRITHILNQTYNYISVIFDCFHKKLYLIIRMRVEYVLLSS